MTPGIGTSPVVINDRTLLPVRALIEEIGGTVAWNSDTQEVTLKYGEDTIRLVIDNTTAYLNNTANTLDAVPIIINDRTMLPVRFIAESFNFDVEWNGDEQRIIISKSNQSNNSDKIINLTSKETPLEKGLSAVRYDGEYMFDEFLEQGGAGTDAELVRFLQRNIVQNAGQLNFTSDAFGCSVLSVKNKNGEAIFGRNFDWYSCNGLILMAKPTNGYASISTVNTNFITNAYKGFNSLSDNIRSVVSMYAPLDGMNEKGLCAAVLYIEDAAAINQNTDKSDITTTTAIRLMLDKAATVDEALEF